MKLRSVVLALALSSSPACATPGAAASVSDSLALELHLSSNEFVVGQPIPFLVVLWNNGSSPLADVAPLTLDQEFLKLEVEAVPGGHVAGPRIRAIWDTMYPTGGVTLPAGHALFEAWDVLNAIGTESNGAGRLSALIGDRALAPRTYRVRATFNVHTHYSGSLGVAPVSLASAWQDFRVDSIGPGDRDELERLWIDAGSPTLGSDGRLTPKMRMRTRERAQAIICPRLRELTRSRFFHVAYWIALCDQPEGPNLQLVDSLSAVPGQDVEAAWILAREIARAQWPDSKKEALVDAALSVRRAALQRVVLDSWQVRLAQRKGYVSFDP